MATKFHFGQDRKDGSYRQDRIQTSPGGKHEHTYSKTATDGSGQHKEGWHGKDASGHPKK